jgi:hypothetical protein
MKILYVSDPGIVLDDYQYSYYVEPFILQGSKGVPRNNS